MKAKTFDNKFDSSEKILNQLDLSKARRIGTPVLAPACLLFQFTSSRKP